MKVGTITDFGQSAEVPKASNGKAVDAAKQFEALLIGQMLKTMRESGSGWLGTGEDQAADTAIGMAEEHLASALSAGGGFGLAATVQSGLSVSRHSETPRLRNEFARTGLPPVD